MLQRAFLLSVLIVCSSVHARTFDDDRAPRRMVAQQAMGELRNQGQTLESRVSRLEEDLGSRPLLELHNQIESLRLDLNRLQGQIEVLVNENELAQKRQRDFYVDLDNRLRRLEQAEGADGTTAPRSGMSSPAASSSAIDSNAGPNSSQGVKGTASAAAPASASAASSEYGTPANRNPVADGSDGRAYESGYDLFKTGKYKEAISSFNSFLRSYPESSFAASAHYWIGNSFYALREFKNAVAAQETLIKIYPDSPKVPDAMLNIASSQLELNKKDAARTTLESVIVKYPGSDAADKAKRRLTSIK
ncbi:tol-pal system protein YbgF [Nitrosospira multiformis]|uniref:Cell division coordinator CpoB n=1 Tax=Nitrosospira multiformis TaxID=1231 RepID=A0A1H8LUY6_9PROT|nr:tol-pal system protein YbgF [Nitrosospira multiformis]SEO08962.1 tol-pal system protein YbgF [Nitrosospira multiformis]